MFKGLSYLKRRNSIFIKNFTTYILIFTIPLFIFGIGIYYWMINIAKDQARNTYINALVDVRNNIDGKIDTMNTFAVQLTYIPWVNKYINMEGNSFNYNRVDIVELLNGLQELGLYNATNEFIDDIAINLNGKDTVLSTRGKDNVERFFSDIINYRDISVDDWKSLLSRFNRRVFLPLQETKISNRTGRTLTYIQSLPPGDKSFTATLILLIDEQTLLKNLNTSVLGNGSLYVLDENSNFLTGINTNDQIRAFVDKQKYANQTGILADQTFSNKGKYSFFYVRSKTGWTYVAAVPVGPIIAKINYLRTLTIILVIFYLLVGLILSYNLAFHNYKPLANIVEMMRPKFFTDGVENNEFRFLENSLFSLLSDENLKESEIKMYKPLAINNCLAGLLRKGAVLDNEILEIMEMLNIEFKYKYFMCIAVLLSEDAFLTEDFKNKANTRIIPYNSTLHYVDFSARSKALIINMDNQDLNRPLVNALVACMNDSSVNYRTIGVGRVYNNISDLYKTYSEAFISVDYRFISENGCIVFFEDIDDNNSWAGYLQKEGQIINSIKSGDSENALSLLKDDVSSNMAEHQLTSDMIRHLCYSGMTLALKALEDMSIPISPAFNLKEIFQKESIEDIFLIIKKVYSEACAMISKERESNNVELIQDIVKYIKINYADSGMSLTSVAEAFDISPSYLSRFFKNQTGTNFVDYLNKFRIDISLQLLKEDTTILQVANQVGYDNDITFRRLFKKYTGKTPGKLKGL